MRTSETPAFVGGPVEVLLGVVVLGLATALITAGINRVLDGHRIGDEPGPSRS